MKDSDYEALEGLDAARKAKGFKAGMCPTCWNTGKFRGRENELRVCPWGCIPTSTKTQ